MGLRVVGVPTPRLTQSTLSLTAGASLVCAFTPTPLSRAAPVWPPGLLHPPLGSGWNSQLGRPLLGFLECNTIVLVLVLRD